MGRCKLFEGWTFKLSIPAPFDDPALSGPEGLWHLSVQRYWSSHESHPARPLYPGSFGVCKLVLATEAARNGGLCVVGHQGNTFKIANTSPLVRPIAWSSM